MSAMKRIAMAEGISFATRAEDAAIDGPDYEPLHGRRPAWVGDTVPTTEKVGTIPVPMTPETAALVWYSLRDLLILTAGLHPDALTPHGWVVRECAARRLTGVDGVLAQPWSCYAPVHPETGAVLR